VCVCVFEISLLSSATLFLFDQKYSKSVKYYYSAKELFCIWIYFKTSFIPVMQSRIFSIITHTSHDQSEITLICWFAAQEMFIIVVIFIISLENSFSFIFMWKIYQECIKFILFIKKYQYQAANTYNNKNHY